MELQDLPGAHYSESIQVIRDTRCCRSNIWKRKGINAMNVRHNAWCLFLCMILMSMAAIAANAQDKKPKLVLQITVDQLRGDLPTRYLNRLGAGGFRYLLEKGTYYANAHYRHANTETAVGHATLFTGADPSRHGIIGNSWIDQSCCMARCSEPRRAGS